MKYDTPSTQKKQKAPPIPADIYELELHIIKEDTRKASQYSAGGDPVIHCGFVIVEDTELYGTSVWKNNITPKISPPYDGGKASTLWELLSAILNRKLTTAECNEIGAKEGEVERILKGGRIRGSIDLKEYTDHEGEKAYSNPVTKFFSAKMQCEPFNKEKGDERYNSRIKKESVPTGFVSGLERESNAIPMPEDDAFLSMGLESPNPLPF